MPKGSPLSNMIASTKYQVVRAEYESLATSLDTRLIYGCIREYYYLFTPSLVQQ